MKKFTFITACVLSLALIAYLIYSISFVQNQLEFHNPVRGGIIQTILLSIPVICAMLLKFTVSRKTIPTNLSVLYGFDTFINSIILACVLLFCIGCFTLEEQAILFLALPVLGLFVSLVISALLEIIILIKTRRLISLAK